MVMANGDLDEIDPNMHTEGHPFLTPRAISPGSYFAKKWTY